MAYRCKVDHNQECDGCGFCMPEQEPEEEKKKQCCATCLWIERDDQEEEMVCMNEDSNYYMDVIDENHSCADYVEE